MSRAGRSSLGDRAPAGRREFRCIPFSGCTDKPDSARIRQEILPVRVDCANADCDKIVWAGARQTEDNGAAYGGFLILGVSEHGAAAEAFSATDPVKSAGLFDRVEISSVRRGVFQPELAVNPT